MQDALLNKSGQAFWQVWNSKFKNKPPAVMQSFKLMVQFYDNTVIANTFANYFASNCVPLNNDRNDWHTFKIQYNELKEYFTGYPITPKIYSTSN